MCVCVCGVCVCVCCVCAKDHIHVLKIIDPCQSSVDYGNTKTTSACTTFCEVCALEQRIVCIKAANQSVNYQVHISLFLS